MNKCVIPFLCLGLFCLFSFAQSPSTDDTDIEKGIALLYKGMVAKNKAVLEDLTAQDLTYGHSSGIIENKADYVEAVMTGPFDFLSIQPLDQRIQITGDTAIARHIFKAKGVNDGVDTDVRIGVMMTWIEREGKWLLLARQAYKL